MIKPETPQTEPRVPEAEPTPVPAGLPHPWIRVAAGLGICIVAALTAVMLAQYYVKSRPLNLREQTTALAETFEQALVNCRVPKESIARGKQEPHLDAEASWLAVTFDVDLPETMDGSALIKLVARRMQPYNVALIESSFENSVRKAVASLGEREFIVLDIKEKPPKTDFSEACERVVRGVNAWLESQGVSNADIVMTPPERKEDNDAIWQYIHMSAPCPAGMPLDSIETQVRETSQQSLGTVRVAASIGLGGTTSFTASLDGRTCLDIVLTRTEVEPPDEEPSVGTLPSLHASPGQENLDAGIPNIEDLPLDSADLEDMELGRKLTGVSTPPNEIPRIALIVDDGGYGGPATNSFLALDPKLTLAILPNTPFAARTAKRAQELGFEVILHMPMESKETPGRLATNMSETKMRQRLDDDLAQVPGAVGVNNHMGSVLTANTAAVNRFMKCLAGRGLYFIDSRTTARTTAFDLALKNEIPAGTRDVFLDNNKEPNYVIGQFNHLMDVAKERGQAIGICHFRATTAQVLVTMLPQLEKNGIKLVHASELVQRPAVVKPLTVPMPTPQEKTANTAPIPAKPRP